VLHAELPLPLMVHTRAPRWALTMAKHRPLAVEIAAPDRVTFRVRVDAVEIDGATTPTNAIATISYRIQRDQFGDYFLSGRAIWRSTPIVRPRRLNSCARSSTPSLARCLTAAA
jgi:hypothetical protein